MNRQDIERLAREANGHPYTNRYTPGETAFAFSIDRLEHFVSLVAAAEREACAALVDANAAVCRNNSMLADVLAGNADAIRARKDKQ